MTGSVSEAPRAAPDSSAPATAVEEIRYPVPEGRQAADICIVGGGFTGLARGHKKYGEGWEWPYGEHAAGMLQKDELPVGAWRVWFHDHGPFRVPVREIYEMRKAVLNVDFVQFFDEHMVSQSSANPSV